MKLEHSQLIGTIREHKYRISSLAITPDNKKFASASSDNTVKIWNLETGELIHNLTDHSSDVNSIAITPDGKILVSGSSDSTVKFWDIETGELINTISGYSRNKGVVRSVAISPDGSLLACSRDYCDEGDNRENECIIQIWRLDTLEPITFLTGDFETTIIEFSNDGKYIAGCFWESGKVWKVPTWELINTFEAFGLHGEAAFSPDLKVVSQNSYKSSDIYLRNVFTGQEIKCFPHTEEWEDIETSGFGFTSDSKVLVSGGCGSNILNFWELPTANLIGSIRSSIESDYTALQFNSDNKILVAGGWDGEIEVWQVSFEKNSPLDMIPFGEKNSLPPDFNSALYYMNKLKGQLNLGDDGLPK